MRHAGRLITCCTVAILALGAVGASAQNMLLSNWGEEGLVLYQRTAGARIGDSGLTGPYWPWNVWTTFAGTYVAPEGTDVLEIQLTAATGATPGSNCEAHVDNVVLEAGGALANERGSWSRTKALYRR